MAEEFDKIWRYPLERQHVVDNPIIFNTDIDLQRRMFWEAAYSTGIIVEFYNCCRDDADWYNDPNCRWDDAIKLPVIFDDHPKVRVLKDFGWYSEDEERPELVYLPMYKDWETKELLDVRENSLMRIHYYGMTVASEFRVMNKKMDSLYGVYWICKLAPERLNDFYLIQENGRHFLKRKQRDDTCNHMPDNDINNDNVDARKYENDQFINNLVKDDSSDDYYDLIMNGDTENNSDFFEDYNENTDVIKNRKDEDK